MHSPVGQIEYTPSDSTPAFIWSLAFSGDGSHLAVGCWSGKTHIYELSRGGSHENGPNAPDSGDGDGSLQVTEKAMIYRSERVYAVAIDTSCNHVCIGGRDKMCAMYQISTVGGETSASLLWMAAADDYVYAVALSDDLTYCAFGGTAKAVTVLNGRTGVQVCRIGLPGTVWTIAILPGTADLPTCMAIGGETSIIKARKPPSEHPPPPLALAPSLRGPGRSMIWSTTS